MSVWSAPTLKPINNSDILAATKDFSVVFTLEEHSVCGGLGSIASEVLSASLPKRVVSIGVQDRFSHNCGSYDYLLQEHGLDIRTITRKIKSVLAEV